MTNAKIRAVVAGHICLDIIPGLNHLTVQAADFFNPGKMVAAGPLSLCPGGCVSNTGLALLKLGIPTALMGKTGDDACGRLLQVLLESRGAGRGLLVTPGADTSTTVILSPGKYDRMFLHNTGANTTFSAADIDYDLVSRAELFHLGYPPVLDKLCENNGEELVSLFRRVKALGPVTSLDMTMPDPAAPGGQVDWEQVLARLMPSVDIFLPSAAELLFMLERSRYAEYCRRQPDDPAAMVTGDDVSRLSRRLRELGGSLIGIKCGERGFYLHTAQGEFWLPAFRAACYAGATGAGDAAIAGFLAAYLRGHTHTECMRFAAAAGASNVTAPDALSGIMTWDEATAALQRGWEQIPLTVTGSGWCRQEDGMWIRI